MARVPGGRLRNFSVALAAWRWSAVLPSGLPAVNRGLPPERRARADRPYLIGGGVTVMPPGGAVLDVTGTRPGDEEGRVLFRLGPVRDSLVVRPFEGSLEAAATSLRRRITDTSGYQVTGAQLGIATADGLAGLQGGYAGPGRGGRYAVFVTNGHTIEVTVSGAD